MGHRTRRNAMTFHKISERFIFSLLNQCDRLERTVSMSHATHRHRRKPEKIWAMKEQDVAFAVDESVVEELQSKHQLEHYGPEEVEYQDTGNEVWYVNRCEHCDAFQPLNPDHYCQACEEECELCNDRVSHEEMETDHVCKRCAENAGK